MFSARCAHHPPSSRDRCNHMWSTRASRQMRSCFVAAISIYAVSLGASVSVEADQPAARWWRGNIHTHSLWSDGNDFPEMIADWYRQKGYNFLALSDHNVLSQGVRWMKYDDIVKRGYNDALEKYRQRFGDNWVETRG